MVACIAFTLAGLAMVTGASTAAADTTVVSPSADAASQTAAVDATLQQEANVTPSAVSATPLCSTPQPGAAACDAIALTLKANGDFVHPSVASALGAQPGPLAASATPAITTRAASATPAATPLTGGAGMSAGAGADDEPGAALEPNAGTPAWLQQAYDTTWLSANRGSGDTVAIVDAYDDPSAESDLAVYRSTSGLPACTVAAGCLTILNQSGQTESQASSWPAPNSSWEGEETLDLDAVSALCPNCHIVLVEANSNSVNNFVAAEATAAAYPGVNQISNSWGATGAITANRFTFSGISVLAASGDAGYEQSNAAQYPAGFAGVTAVGGTSLTTGSTSGARGFTETAWTGAGSSCATHVAQPAWQTGQSCAGRATSDIAADADPDTGLLIYGTAVGGWALFGGTSLATPLAAAYEAITQPAGTTTPQWSYTDAAGLNDITAGNNDTSPGDTGGACAASLAYLCNAGVGFDGPTGNGSIDGDLATGGPGVGGPDACAPGSCSQPGAGYATSTTASGAQLQAQIYPNGLQTSYYWEYGATTGFGQQTAITTVAAATAPATVQTTLVGLAAGATYYYRLVASNADGTVYGYTFSLATAAAPPAPTSTVSAPTTDSGSSQTVDSSTVAAPVSATPAPALPVVTVTTPTTVTTTPTTTVPTQTSAGGAGASGPGKTVSAKAIVLLLSGGAAHAAAGDLLTAALPAGAHATAAGITQFMRCRKGCSAVKSAGARYRLTGADAGALMRVRYTPSWGGAYSSAYVGPVLTRTTAGAILASGRSATLRTASGAALASAKTITADRRKHVGHAVTVAVTRAPHVRGALQAWLCPTALDAQRHPLACTAPSALRQRTTLRTAVAGAFAVVVQR